MTGVPHAVLRVTTEEVFTHIYAHAQEHGLVVEVTDPYRLEIDDPATRCTAIFKVRRRPFRSSYGLYVRSSRGNASACQDLIEQILAHLRQSLAVV
jgi:hypothetical protein